MPYYISKPHMFNLHKSMYYTEDNNWSDDFSKRKKFRTKKSATKLKSESTHFSKASIIKE